MSIQILCKLVNVFAQPAAAADLTGDKVQLIESPGEKRKRRRETGDESETERSQPGNCLICIIYCAPNAIPSHFNLRCCPATTDRK